MDNSTTSLGLKKKIGFIKDITLTPFVFTPTEFFTRSDNICSYLSDFSEGVSNEKIIVLEKYVLSEHISHILREFENLIVFTNRDCQRIIAQLISKQPHGEEGELVTTGCLNVFFVESKQELYPTNSPCMLLVSWLEQEQKWLVVRTGNVYFPEKGFNATGTTIFTYSNKNIVPEVVQMRDECIARVQSTELPDELKEEFTKDLHVIGNDTLAITFGSIIKTVRYTASHEMDLICKYKGKPCEKNLWSKYYKLHSAWEILRNHFLKTFPESTLSPLASRDPGWVDEPDDQT